MMKIDISMTIEVDRNQCFAIYECVHLRMLDVKENNNGGSVFIMIDALITLDYKLYKIVHGFWTKEKRKLTLHPKQLAVLYAVFSRIDFTIEIYEANFLNQLYGKIDQKLK